MGQMSISQRNNSLSMFQENKYCNVLLGSIMESGVGINLQHAENVYIRCKHNFNIVLRCKTCIQVNHEQPVKMNSKNGAHFSMFVAFSVCLLVDGNYTKYWEAKFSVSEEHLTKSHSSLASVEISRVEGHQCHIKMEVPYLALPL
ncbi:uncharacterized protein VP01_1191g2 [Puccinia sorghi]|uniref:Uncharacterized protein n=1 Tax=Puccinia sorghi TaxID=27349 RepID=A0A0L6VS95_9BASI|nr:uncharacterized protein VP01_1191g2 [Puccinia sorghi]